VIPGGIAIAGARFERIRVRDASDYDARLIRSFMSAETPSEPPRQVERVHERWPGNETFLCRGRIVAGPRPRAAFATATLITVPTGIFLGLVAPVVVETQGVWVYAVASALAGNSLIWLFKTSFTDPGILPRLERRSVGTSSNRGKTRDCVVETTGKITTTRWNDTCGYFQPPRAHHCSVCNDCIEKFDHYCPWTGTTIGLRNYRAFLSFVFGTAAYCVFIATECGYGVSYETKKTGSIGEGFKRSGPAIGVFIVAALGFLFVGALSGFHAYLISTNQTTYESFRDAHGWSANPYNTGSIVKNCLEVWFARVPRAKVRFNATTEEDDSAERFERALRASERATLDASRQRQQQQRAESSSIELAEAV